MRKKIYGLLESSRDGDWYDILMLVAILTSVVPLMFVEEYPVFRIIEIVTVSIFIVDYLLRWLTADYRLQKKGWSFVIYPFTGWAIIDMLSILPGLSLIGRGSKILQNPTWANKYKGYLRELCDDLFSWEKSHARISAWQDSIYGFISNDTGEDMTIDDRPAGWGNHGEYRIMSDGSNNYFKVKAAAVAAMH